MIIRGRLLIVVAALVSLAYCNTDEKKDGRAGKPLNPNGPSFMRKRQWTGETEPRPLADIADDRPLMPDEPAMTLKAALQHLRLRREQHLELQQRLQHLQQLRPLRGVVWLQ